MNSRHILDIALAQSAIELNCSPNDFSRKENVVTPFMLGEGARKYYRMPISCNFVTYGSNIVASVCDELHDIVQEYLARYDFSHCFETPNMHWLTDRIAPLGHRICFMAEYFLPDINRLRAHECVYEMRVLGQPDFAELYTPEWSNALCDDRRELDVLGVGAYDGDRLTGLAACSADCDTMWQIGVDVLPEYRRQGIASALTSRLALEILERDKVPFYCCAWSNIRSARNAVKSGFVPAWAEMTVKPADIVDRMNEV